jgi:6-pyruvoyltetrahydropterin/6-carboxytetrahydropterin synthase
LPDLAGAVRDSYTAVVRIFREFRFEAAHRLPDAPPGHKCRQLHGHSYRLVVHVEGVIERETGWVMDFADIKRVVDPVIAELDHQYLNEIEGLGKPTAEVITVWLWRRIKPQLRGLCRLELWETASAGCIYEGEAAD